MREENTENKPLTSFSLPSFRDSRTMEVKRKSGSTSASCFFFQVGQNDRERNGEMRQTKAEKVKTNY